MEDQNNNEEEASASAVVSIVLGIIGIAVAMYFFLG